MSETGNFQQRHQRDFPYLKEILESQRVNRSSLRTFVIIVVCAFVGREYLSMMVERAIILAQEREI